MERNITLSQEEWDRLIQLLDLLRSDIDAQHLAYRIYSQLTYNPADHPEMTPQQTIQDIAKQTELPVQL